MRCSWAAFSGLLLCPERDQPRVRYWEGAAHVAPRLNRAQRPSLHRLAILYPDLSRNVLFLSLTLRLWRTDQGRLRPDLRSSRIRKSTSIVSQLTKLSGVAWENGHLRHLRHLPVPSRGYWDEENVFSPGQLLLSFFELPSANCILK
jgi:hypothetical protein